MKLDEAILTLEQLTHYLYRRRKPDSIEATLLGIEALKREKEHRDLDIDTRFGLLPGETEE